MVSTTLSTRACAYIQLDAVGRHTSRLFFVPIILCVIKSFASTSNLNKHKKTIHRNIEPYPCRLSTCSKQFKYVCEANKVCCFIPRLILISNLFLYSQHYDTVHCGLRPCQCRFCARRSSDKSNCKKYKGKVCRKKQHIEFHDELINTAMVHDELINRKIGQDEQINTRIAG